MIKWNVYKNIYSEYSFASNHKPYGNGYLEVHIKETIPGKFDVLLTDGYSILKSKYDKTIDESKTIGINWLK